MCLARAHAALPLMDVMQLRSAHERRYYTWGRGVIFHLRGLLPCYTVLGDHIITSEGVLRYYTWWGLLPLPDWVVALLHLGEDYLLREL